MLWPEGQVISQVLAVQISPNLHVLPQLPQFFESVLTSTQIPWARQATWPVGQDMAHLPLPHSSPALHAVSQAPQCLLSRSVVTQADPQSLVPGPQLEVSTALTSLLTGAASGQVTALSSLHPPAHTATTTAAIHAAFLVYLMGILL